MFCKQRWAVAFVSCVLCFPGTIISAAAASDGSPFQLRSLTSPSSLRGRSHSNKAPSARTTTEGPFVGSSKHKYLVTRILTSDSSSVENGTRTAGAGASAEHLSSDWPKFMLDWQNGLAILVSIVTASMANAAGVGGGGMFVPMFSLLGFDTKTATALSQAMITGGAVTSFMFNIRLQHPTQRRPLIDYDIALLLEPMLLLGISIGVVFNIVVPAWLIVVLLSILLSYMAWRTLAKGLSVWKVESGKAAETRSTQMAATRGAEEHGGGHGAEAAEEHQRQNPEEAQRRIDPASADVTMSHPRSRQDEEEGNEPTDVPFLQKATVEQLQRLKAILMPETSIIPKWRLAEVLFIWIVFLWLQIFKGGRSSPSIVGVRSCSQWFWVLVALQLPLCTAFTIWEARRLWLQRKARVADGFAYEAGDVQWRVRELVLYPILALLAGSLAGLLGIGGGMMIGPLLLEMGVLPQVTAATGALMVLFSSSMALAQFSILHLVPFQHALIYGGICAVSGYVGLVAVRAAIAKYGRTSIIIFALAIVIGTSAAVVAVTGGFKIRNEIEQHAYMGFETLCPAKAA